MMFRKLHTILYIILISLNILLVMGCALQVEQANNVATFPSPQESQTFKGSYGPSVAAQEVVILDHYLTGYKSSNPRLYIEYTNISTGGIKIEIDIAWFIANQGVVSTSGQYDIRPLVAPGQSERLIYKPIVTSPSEIVDYSIVVHSLLDERLPHITFGSQIDPEQIASLTTPSSEEMTIAWGKKVTPEFKTKVIEISNRLGVDVNYLMAAMAFETGNTFDPSITNKLSGATGLIQFLPKTAGDLGTNTQALSAMSTVEQLDYVEKYFQPYKGQLATLEDVYMAILWPKAIGKASDYILFSEPTTAYSQNRGLDLNSDGKVTKSEASAKVRNSLTEGLASRNKR